ncbi:MAG: dephospho-CoA kinase [Propionibacteriaceae bacterium]|jgi:dephospho-CoA kinase|nr:dephospho-CoA kinase [Propionibacteriaceae bacterium]
MLRVGLTGGIAAGKSVASARFVELGIMVVDYDTLAHDVVAPGTPGLAAVVQAFGRRVLARDGSLNRAVLGEHVFGDDEARDKLEDIIHPLVIKQGYRLDGEAARRGETMVIHDIPLLVEAAGPEAFDVVIVVDAPAELRAERLVNERGMSEEEAWDRIRAQADDDVRRDAADVVFDGSGTVENLRRQVDEWVESLAK